MTDEVGLRTRKKLRTREAISNAALGLFIERGYENVTLSEIARAAEVSVATVFSYFPDGKDALVFEQDEDRPAAIAEAIQTRGDGASVMDAVEAFILSRGPFRKGNAATPVQRLIAETAPLRAYAQKRWAACEPVLRSALAEESRRPEDVNVRALARYVLEIPEIAAQDADPRATVGQLFTRLRAGWGIA
ncbi:TetR family transcriptional regulator [Propionicimonas paludicola]|uniref:TetR family transcriptional regulator n=1 Tax=Propionicimonas paludicola TaxID=185243 RepID=A0A2A9CM27_9ACTN|nr:TetR/AcrR family transcriptional regulator [Propionicimonas paludicola]PFG15507.1 TetR family transcriptional regulator [Propionicimonas paludicola]